MYRPSKSFITLVTACMLTTASLSVGCSAPALHQNKTASDALQAPSSPATADASHALNQDAFEANQIKKQQVVYVKSNATGAQQGVYVVNSFDSDASQSICDQGPYTSVTNLTDTQALDIQDKRVLFAIAPNETFRYQGDLTPDTATPWNVNITYELDGQQIDPAQLSGAHGKVSMTLHIEPNASCAGNYSQNYLMQVTAQLKNSTIHNINAEDATLAQAGDNTQLTYMVFPDQQADYTITCDADSFTFDGFQLVAIPLSLALNVDDHQFDDATAELNTLSNALSQLNHGTKDLQAGANRLKAGADQLDQSGDQLIQGAQQAQNALTRTQQGALQLSNAINNQLIPGINQLSQGSNTYVKQLDQTIATLKQQTKGMSPQQAEAVYKQALTAFAHHPTDPAAQQGVKDAQSLVTAVQVLKALETTRAGYEPLNNGIQQMNDEHSPNSIVRLGAGAQELADGLKETQQGFGELAGGMGDYAQGVHTLDAHMSELQSGASALEKGSSKICASTSGMDKKLIETVRDRIQSYLHPEFTPADFVTGSTQITRVQFVYKTKGIAANE